MHVLVFTVDRDLGDFFKNCLFHKQVTATVVQLTPRFMFEPGFYRFDLYLFLLGKNGEGISALKAVYREAYHYPIFAVISEITDSLSHRLQEANVRKTFVRPYDFDAIVAEFHATITKKYRLQEMAELHAGDLTLHLDRHELHYHGYRHYLRNKEFELLRLFMTNPNRILSRTEILERVWDHQISSPTNSVEVHIAKLRKKLRAKELKTTLRTIPCVGYQLVTENKIKFRQ